MTSRTPVAAGDASASGAAASPRPLRLGIHGSTHLAARIVAAADHPVSSIEYIRYEVSEPFRLLRAGETDLMLVKYDPFDPDIALSQRVAWDGRAVLVGAHHPLAAQESVSLEQIADYEGFRCPGDFPPNVWDLVVPPHTWAGRAIRRTHTMTTVLALVERLRSTLAMHVSFQSLEAVLPPDIKVVPVHDLPPSPVALAWLRGTRLPERAWRFVRDAERAAER
ncbi:LysR substrate-binding domain-containing protein [Saccharopolyspora sp. ID03-671]|uniref:LysR substrate-binding domain-containing protein n=1 Tax=Saccharopolyspora sp. ID03-671 TaxID=3073066 RepID=UPI0032537F03